MSDWIGYRWLADRYGVSTVQAFRTDSAIAKSRATVREDGYVHEQHPPTARPVKTLAGHLTFALKHEGVHLEFLSRLFATAPVAELEAWVAAEPTGQHARRAGFFYEYLTGRQLDFPGVVAGNYVTALDGKTYLTASQPANNQRWRVRDNLPGSRHYCPMVLRTARVQQAEQYNCAQHLAALEVEFGADVLQRSAVGERYGPFDVTLLECGAYNDQWPLVHMLPEEVIRAHGDLRGRLLVPIHNGSFDLGMHPWKEPIERISALARAQGVLTAVPMFGERMTVGATAGTAPVRP